MLFLRRQQGERRLDHSAAVVRTEYCVRRLIRAAGRRLGCGDVALQLTVRKRDHEGARPAGLHFEGILHKELTGPEYKFPRAEFDQLDLRRHAAAHRLLQPSVRSRASQRHRFLRPKPVTLKGSSPISSMILAFSVSNLSFSS